MSERQLPTTVLSIFMYSQMFTMWSYLHSTWVCVQICISMGQRSYLVKASPSNVLPSSHSCISLFLPVIVYNLILILNISVYILSVFLLLFPLFIVTYYFPLFSLLKSLFLTYTCFSPRFFFSFLFISFFSLFHLGFFSFILHHFPHLSPFFILISSSC